MQLLNSSRCFIRVAVYGALKWNTWSAIFSPVMHHLGHEWFQDKYLHPAFVVRIFTAEVWYIHEACSYLCHPCRCKTESVARAFSFFLREGWSFKARCPRRNTFQGKSITANYIDCGKRFVTREPELPRTNGKYHTMQVATARPIRFLVQGKFRVDFYALCTA